MTNVLLNEQDYGFCLKNSNFDERSKYCCNLIYNHLEDLFPSDTPGFKSCRDNFCDICCSNYFNDDIETIKHAECSKKCESR